MLGMFQIRSRAYVFYIEKDNKNREILGKQIFRPEKGGGIES